MMTFSLVLKQPASCINTLYFLTGLLSDLPYLVPFMFKRLNLVSLFSHKTNNLRYLGTTEVVDDIDDVLLGLYRFSFRFLSTAMKFTSALCNSPILL